MCLPAAAIPAATLAVSAVSTGFGIYSGYQQAQYQQAQAAQAARAQARQLQYQQQADAQRMAAMRQQQQLRARAQQVQYQGQVQAHNASMMAYETSIFNNSKSANKVYEAEQLKLKEARDKAAFKSEEIYAKQIGATGKILASGQTGQSVGAQVRDVTRQAGRAEAKENATLRSAETAAGMAMDAARDQQMSANNRAYNALPAAPIAPLGIPYYS